MIKRYGLVVFLFCFSIILGITLALLEAAKVFFFSIGILFLVGLAAALFAIVTISWLVLKRKRHIRNPEQSVRHQGTAFSIWFAVHNLFWAFIGSFFIWGVFKLFGFKPWVMIFSAGALACTCFALIGTFLVRQREMLGLCWQSSIPDGLANFWARAGATMILRERYEYAVQHDQKQHTPLLWSISRIFNRSKTGGADRGIDLLEPRPTFLAKKLKKEWLHRFKVLLVLFWVTAALAALSGVLFASHHWDRVPEGWPSDKIKASKADKPQMMASKNSQPENRKKNISKDENKQTDQEQKKQPDQGNQSNQTDQNQQKSGDSDQNDSNREQERKEGKNSKDQETEGQGQEQGQSQGQGKEQQGKDQGQDQGQGKGQDQAQGQGQQSQGQGQQGQGKGQEQGQQKQSQGQEQGQDQGQGEDHQEQGQSQDQGQGQQGQGEGQGQGQGQAQGQEQQGEGQGQGKGKGQGQGQGEGQGQGQGQGQEQRQSQSQEQGETQTGDAGVGIGEGQGPGDPNKSPEMLSEPERLPDIPSRTTEMVNLELPTLTDAKSKGSKDQDTQIHDDRIPSPKSKAPGTQFKTGKQERRSTKPEQYLPNWILNLLKQEKPVKTGKKSPPRHEYPGACPG
jgi:hypothetical protein